MGFIEGVIAVNDYVNLLDLTYNAFNAIKKKVLVDYIEKIKGKVVADKQIQKLCSEIANLSDNFNERLTRKMMVTKNVNNILEIRNVNLEKHLSKNEQYGRRNNVEISDVSSEIPNQDLEKKVTKMCKESDVKYITYGY